MEYEMFQLCAKIWYVLKFADKVESEGNKYET